MKKFMGVLGLFLMFGCGNEEYVKDKLVFVTSELYQGNFGNISNLDDKCNELANNAGINANFSAWISNSNTDAKDRFEHSSGNYILINGNIIAENWNDLTNGKLKNSINIDENGNVQNTIVWTGTLIDGTKTKLSEVDFCNNWNSNEFTNYSTYGYSVKSDEQWTNVIDGTSPTFCAEAAAIYCIEN